MDKEIADYLLQLSFEQKKVVLSVVTSFAREDDARWDNQPYIDEMDRRLSDLESREIKGITLETLAQEARKAYIKRLFKQLMQYTYLFHPLIQPDF